MRNLAEASLEIDEFAAPLPNLRFQGFYAFTPRVSVNGALGWLSLNIDEWDGDFLYWQADIDYRIGGSINLPPSRTLGVAAVQAGKATVHHDDRLDAALAAQFGTGGEFTAATVIAGFLDVLRFLLLQDLFW